MFDSYGMRDCIKPQIQKIVELTKAHPGEFNQKELCQITGLAPFTVCKWVNILNLPVKKKHAILPFHESYIKQYARFRTQQEMADTLGIGVWDVRKIAKKLNISFKRQTGSGRPKYFEHDPFYK
jgi:hypothetical protein